MTRVFQWSNLRAGRRWLQDLDVVAVAWIAAGLALWEAGWSGPIFRGATAVPVARVDLALAGGVAYERGLLAWPLVAAAWMVLAGLGTLPLGRLGRGRWSSAPWLDLMALWATAAGAMAAVSGARWIGFAWARRLDTSATPVHLAWAPYAELVLGLLVVATAAQRLLAGTAPSVDPNPRRVRALSLATGGLTLAGLFASALVPLAAVPGSGGARFHLDELTLATLAAVPNVGGHELGRAMALIRLLLWLILAAAAAQWFIARRAELRPTVTRRIALASPWVHAGLGAAALALWGAALVLLQPLRPAAGGPGNPVLALCLAAVYGVAVWSAAHPVRGAQMEPRGAETGSAAVATVADTP